MDETAFALGPLDTAILVGYFLFILSVGAVLSRLNKGAEDYFLAGRRMIWPFIGLSLFASNISSQTLIGLSGSAYNTGISVYAYEWMAAVVLVVFALVFLPILLRARVFTMPEFLARRFDRRARLYFSALTLFLNVVVDTAAGLYAGSLVLKMVFPALALWQIIVLLALVAGLYTIAGGLAAVIYTDALQAILLVVGSSVIAATALHEAGGWQAVLDQVPEAKLSLIRPLDAEGVPWLGLITGVPLLGFYYWATNQTIVQRALAAKSVEHGRWGALFAGLLKLLPLFIMVLPGSFALVLYPRLDNPDLVFPRLMFDLLPAGLLGLTLAGFIAAIMSAIDSALNSASTLVTMDFIQPLRPDLSSRRLMQVGRAVMAGFMGLAMLWAPQIRHFESLFDYLQTMFAYLVSPTVALFLLGLFWPRANGQGAFAGLMAGLAVGLAAFAAIEWLNWIDVHFLYVAPLLAGFTALVVAGVSLRTPAPDAEAIAPYVWRWSVVRAQEAALPPRPVYLNAWVQSAALLALVALLVYTFR
ncbi:sodium transporter [Rhodothalassium salexigens]|uniref:sodium:solute symporter n=1 Tax=Rhodothalassium salexigens TaxID=1086 RepID=UPI00191207BC|nr:sodium:solute symporter [Rhodothalassium salexigens]MBK5912280.1 sodium transporter [Rhodothalassium salexigens]MBK5920298.1 sodium transporter [Rhodothalassium salexigens]